MRVTNIRRGRIARICAIAIIVIGLIYVIATLTDGHNKARELYNSKFAAKRTGEKPVLIEGNMKIVKINRKNEYLIDKNFANRTW